MVRRKGGHRRLDLHGMTADEAITHFVTQSNSFLAAGQTGHLVVIHGYGSSGLGEGTIKRRIRELVRKWPAYFEAVRCDDSLPGETWVVPLKPFPTQKRSNGSLEQQIVEFCASRRTEKQIFERFSSKPQQDIWKLLYGLRGKGLLEIVMKKGEKAWRVPIKPVPD
jgi:hypothetical protein